MQSADKPSYTVSLDFRPIKLPPVTDILVLARKHVQGKVGIMEAFRFIAPDEFEMIEINEGHPIVEAVLVNKKILKRIPQEEVLRVLERTVFPYVYDGEAYNVNFSVTLSFDNIRGEL